MIPVSQTRARFITEHWICRARIFHPKSEYETNIIHSLRLAFGYAQLWMKLFRIFLKDSDFLLVSDE